MNMAGPNTTVQPLPSELQQYHAKISDQKHRSYKATGAVTSASEEAI